MNFSIIIPIYNVELYIEHCLLSVLNQNYNDLEVILVDDCSKDNSMGVVRRVLAKHQNADKVVILKHEKNRGPSAARNTGLNVAKGKYVWFIDSDDYIKENCLHEIFSKTTELNIDICMFSAANVIYGKIIKRFSFNDFSLNVNAGKFFLRDFRFSTCVPFKIYKRDFLSLNNLKFFEGIFHEDNEFTPRCLYMANRVAYLDEILYFVVQNPNSTTRTINIKRAYDYIIVLNNLFDFCHSDVEDCDKAIFYNIIAKDVNNLLLLLSKVKDKKARKDCYNKLKENYFIIDIMRKSSIIKYRIEAILFMIFRNYLFVYNLIQIFNPRWLKSWVTTNIMSKKP